MLCCVLGRKRTDRFRAVACAVVCWVSCVGCSDPDLRKCSRRGYNRTTLPISTAFSDCTGIHRTQATVSLVRTAPDGGSGSVALTLSQGACAIGFDVSRPVDDWPSWPWLVEGAQLDISLWEGGDTRGGDPLWMVLRDSVTGDPLFTIHQLNGVLISDGTLRDEIGIDADIVGPVCEDSAAVEESGLLIHRYNLRLSSEGKSITLGEMSEGSLPSSNASLSWRIETGILVDRLPQPNYSLTDVRFGGHFQIIAWTEPR
jgi:hypothetical protein